MLRRIARPLLATTFVADGIAALTDPSSRIEAAGRLARRGERVLPRGLGAYLRDNPSRIVEINAAIRVGGGALLAMGKLPRLSAMALAATAVPTTVTEHDFWNEKDPDRRTLKRAGFLQDASMLGALLIAATDREGRPSLAWRGRRALARFRTETAPRRAHFAETADTVRERGAEVGEALRDRGEHFAEATRELGARAESAAAQRGGRLLDTARHHGGDLYDTTRDRTGELLDTARDRREELLDTARDRGEDLLGTARDRSGDLLGTARDRGGDLLGTARDRGEELLDTARGSELYGLARERGEQLTEAARRRSRSH
ncbi:DoxX family membrane protein [Nocardia sp. alder85J]|uniref:DoxX family membrane protein n=1 Tax=Nocardia sp. alder85J TaxID=2862949 RepID=UPI001CD4BC32|nr:DoxX family membrane protein [Nocardia sp. alder85J]MCX4092981.1 DoxX family membrane protein [Nocardia sp. alder85J]